MVMFYENRNFHDFPCKKSDVFARKENPGPSLKTVIDFSSQKALEFLCEEALFRLLRFDVWSCMTLFSLYSVQKIYT